MSNGKGKRCTVVERRLVTSLEAIDGICSDLREGAFCEIPQSERFPVELMLREALTNAVRHGISGKSDGAVCCEIECLCGGVALRISDTGDGFPWREQLVDAPVPLAESGRGLQIMRLYADTLRYNEAGNRVEIIRMFSQGREDGKF